MHSHPLLPWLSRTFVRTHSVQLLKFSVCGGIGASIDLGSTAFFVEIMDVPPALAYLPATGLAVLFVFLANKFFTFRNLEAKYASQALKFAMVYGTAIVMNLAISWTLLWLGLHYLLARCVAIGVGAFWNYSMSHSFVFRRSEVISSSTSP